MDMDPDSNRSNFIDNLAFTIDSHLHEIRIALCSATILALGYAVKSVKPFTKFTCIQQIPQSFIEKHIKLSGRVVDLKSTDYPSVVNTESPVSVSLSKVFLFVDHRPVLSAPFASRSQATPLTVTFDSVVVSAAGLATLREIVLNQDIGFVLLSAQEEESLACIVYCRIPTRGFWRRLFSRPRSVSLYLTEQGLASPGEALPSLSIRSPLYRNYMGQLLQAEGRARRRQLGMWKIEKEDGNLGRNSLLWEKISAFIFKSKKS